MIQTWVCNACLKDGSKFEILHKIVQQDLPGRRSPDDDHYGFGPIDPDLEVDDGF